MPLLSSFSTGGGRGFLHLAVATTSTPVLLQLILWGTAAELDPGHEVFKAFRATAQEFKGKLVFVTTNNEASSHEPITNFFGLKGGKSPVVRDQGQG